MSFKILCASQKGGVGKSTLSQLIAIGYAKSDYKVLLADMDVQQKTTSEWFEDRVQNSLSEMITVRSFRNVPDVLKLADADDYDLVVFDGAPHATAQTLDMARSANLIILPHKEGKADMRPQVKLANELVKAGIQKENIVFVLNQTTSSENQIKLAYEYIGQTPYHILKTYIPQKPGILIGADNGLSIMELPFASLREKGNNLFRDIATTLLKNYKDS